MGRASGMDSAHIWGCRGSPETPRDMPQNLVLYRMGCLCLSKSYVAASSVGCYPDPPTAMDLRTNARGASSKLDRFEDGDSRDFGFPVRHSCDLAVD